jgi:hypothetical protein
MGEFKVIIAGGRNFNDFPTLCAEMDKRRWYHVKGIR